MRRRRVPGSVEELFNCVFSITTDAVAICISVVIILGVIIESYKILKWLF